MSADLTGKVVLITGASSGIGRDAALQFAAAGSKVAAAARRADRLQQLVREILAAGGTAAAFPVDIANPTDARRMVAEVRRTFGPVDILFNNAGFGRILWHDRMQPEHDIDRQIAVNLLGVIHAAHAVLPDMLARRSGHIINNSSVAGWIAPPTYTVYAASKYGVRGYTEALRRELAPYGIHVSGLYPGPVITEFGQHAGEQPLLESSAGTKLRRGALSSAYVAARVVALVRRPRRALILPGYYRIVLWLDWLAPGLIDWFATRAIRRARG